MKLTSITFTGIDERTDFMRLENIAKKYTFAEFGLLVSRNWEENGNRFPDPQIIWDMTGCTTPQVRFSCHLCGQLAKTAAHGDFPNAFPPDWSPSMLNIFQRVQLNVDAMEMYDVLHQMPKSSKEIIIQMQDAATCCCFMAGGRPDGMSYLLDASGGRGIDSPMDIIDWTGIHVGYAGGIGPENVERKLLTLLLFPSNNSFWIDMESKIRTADDWLDLDKVEEVCEICEGVMNNYNHK